MATEKIRTEYRELIGGWKDGKDDEKDEDEESHDDGNVEGDEE